jgi:hypothetical protein
MPTKNRFWGKPVNAPVHPYVAYEGTPVWRTAKKALADLEENRDRRFTIGPVLEGKLSEMTPNNDKKLKALKAEGRSASRMLKGKIVKVVRRHRVREVLVEFTDGTRLFVDAQGDEIELSITAGPSEQY